MHTFFYLKHEIIIKHELLNLFFVIFIKYTQKTFFFKKMKSTLKNKKDKNTEKPIKALRVKWIEPAIKALLSFLFEHKEKLEVLKYKHGATSNPKNVQLWKDAKNFLLDFNFEQSYNTVRPVYNHPIYNHILYIITKFFFLIH